MIPLARSESFCAIRRTEQGADEDIARNRHVQEWLFHLEGRQIPRSTT